MRPARISAAEIHFLTATPDLSHVVIGSTIPLTGAGSGQGLYEWSDGQLRFVSVLPDGTPGPEAELGYFDGLANAISDDGSRVIWTKTEENSARGHLYLRDIERDETVQLDAAQGSAEPSGVGGAQFQGASSDGSRVFFTDKQKLTADSTAQATVPGKPDLYECDITEVAGKLTCQLKDLTVDQNESEHAAVQGFVFGASKDATSVYFAAQGVLASNENGNGETATPAKNNLYLLQFDGSHGRRPSSRRSRAKTVQSGKATRWQTARSSQPVLRPTAVTCRSCLPRARQAMTTSTQTPRPKERVMRRSISMTQRALVCAVSPATRAAHDPWAS